MSAVAVQDAAALDVQEISVSYGGVRAVDGVSFTVGQGSILGLIGPNGAGKTTVFDAICGFAPLAQGQLHLGGSEISGKAPAERSRAGLGRSFQDARLFPSLTVFETMALAFERHVRAQDAVSTGLGMPWVVRTERRIRRRKAGLARGMVFERSRRIVDLACVLAHDPVVLLLDEPSSGIAQRETEALGPLLVRVKEATGCTMLLIEHDMPLVTSVADELIALEIGQIIARGRPHDVTNDARVVEAYLGTDQRIIARSGEGVTEQGEEQEAEERPTPRRRRPARVEGPAPAEKLARADEPARRRRPAAKQPRR